MRSIFSIYKAGVDLELSLPRDTGRSATRMASFDTDEGFSIMRQIYTFSFGVQIQGEKTIGANQIPCTVYGFIFDPTFIQAS